MVKNSNFFSKRLISWYLKNHRDLPWRKTKEPYNIWLSEIILQQTRVDQGLPYYLKFLKTFPTIFDLANASEKEVLNQWQGLGYYSRARNLHHTAQYICKELDGIFPKNYAELLKLKGVGDYTASAIASICFDEPTAVVDGNVYRVLARFFGITLPINSLEGKKYFKKTAQLLIDSKQPGIYNQALMEYGARQCKPQNPDCSSCVFNDKCVSLKEKKVSKLPIKIKTVKIKNLYFNYLVILTEDQKTILHHRNKKGIWQNLFEFPLIETSKKINLQHVKKTTQYQEISTAFSIQSISPFNENPIIHKLSHRKLFATFWIVSVLKIKNNNPNYQTIPISKLKEYPVPTLIHNFISAFFYQKVKTKK